MSNVFDLIQSHRPEYTKADDKIAVYILREQQNVTNMTMADLAQGAGVSEGSVVRFLNKLGMKRLIDLKLAVARAARQQSAPDENFFSAVERDFADVTHNTAALMDPGRLCRAVDLLEQSSHVYFFGVSVSGIAARTAENSFLRLGKPVHAVEEGHMQTVVAVGMNKQDAVVVFSLTGNTRDTCEAAEIARRRGARIISVTSYVNSRLAKISDVVLQTSAREEIINGGRISGLVSQLYVLNCIKREYTRRNQAQIARLKDEIGREILTKKL